MTGRTARALSPSISRLYSISPTLVAALLWGINCHKKWQDVMLRLERGHINTSLVVNLRCLAQVEPHMDGVQCAGQTFGVYTGCASSFGTVQLDNAGVYGA